MLVTYFSTALGLTLSSSTIPPLERPSAISRSTCCSRGVSLLIGSSLRRTSSCATTSGSSAVPPAATRRTASRKSLTCATRSFSRVADRARSLHQQVGRVTLLDVLRQHEQRDLGILPPDSQRRPDPTFITIMEFRWPRPVDLRVC